MRVPQSYIQRCKVTAHGFQALLIFIAGCVTLAVLTKDGPVGGPTRFYFALCFLTLPALIYLVMVPMWTRAQKFANAYAFVAVDALYTIFWFSAFIAIAFWNSTGIKQGAKDKKLDENEGNCTTFKWGNETKCKLSRATFGFGLVIWIFFVITTAISAYYLVKFRKTGEMPYQAVKHDPHHLSGDPNIESGAAREDNAWSTEIDHHSDDEDTHTERGGRQEEDEYALLHSTETDEGRHPGRPLSWGDDRYANDPVPPYAGYTDTASALSPGGYDDYRRQAAQELPGSQHPHSTSTAYTQGPPPGRGYSFSGGDR